MTKKKDKVKTLAAAIVDAVLGEEEVIKREYVITHGAIKDDFCSYAYELVKGIGRLNGHKVEGKHVVMETMKKAFAEFNVHMAIYDNIFTHSNIEIESLKDVVNHPHTFLFEV